uniref:Uncharacterized protein n=1 Tax=Anguilla anguilla TaxID=7936 RepID=A0A0E9PZT4_ANGAN
MPVQFCHLVHRGEHRWSLSLQASRYVEQAP